MTMVTTQVPYLYKEARLNLEPAYPGSTVSFTLPSHSLSTLGSRPRVHRTIVTENYIDQDEDAFAKRHLASEASMFFRRTHNYPRSFLWRVLDDRKVLEIQSTDLDHNCDHKFEADLTIMLHFPSPIRPFGIAFAEPEDRDALSVFVLTEVKELYTITLPGDFFIKAAASEIDINDWCKTSSPFSRVPYRLTALNATELLVSMDDGSIAHLLREHSGDSVWLEKWYKQSSWSLRSLVTWKGQNSVRFNNVDLDGSAAAAMTKSPDGEHIWTVTLDHKLRAWNIKTGKPGAQVDLLGEDDRANEKVAPYFIGPSQSALMAIVNIRGFDDGSRYHIVTYSPKQHQFKFWGVGDADDIETGIIDFHSDIAFIPPVDDLMNTTVWNLEEFFISRGPTRWEGMEIWIRARSGPSNSIYSLKFSLNDRNTRLERDWKHGWVSVDSGPLTVESLKRNPSNPGERDLDGLEMHNPGITQEWLDFLFYPGRFTTASLETALWVYRKGLDRKRSTRHASPKASLKERICAAIAAFSTPTQNQDLDYDDYEESVASQWQVFYGLVKDLHKRRGECLSLAFDPELGMPWLVLSDYLSVIRRCNELETILSNSPYFSPSSTLPICLQEAMHISADEIRLMVRLVHAAALFRKTFSKTFHHEFEQELNRELFSPKSLSVLDRMDALEQSCDLCGQVSDDDLSVLIEEFGVPIKDLTSEVFDRIVKNFEPESPGGGNEEKQTTHYGLKALMRTTQETLEIDRNVLLDLLVVVLFVHFEYQADKLSENLDAAELFVDITNLLKDKAMLDWLASNGWAHPASTGPASEQMMATLNYTVKATRRLPIPQTVMEGIFGYRCFEFPKQRGQKTELVTSWSRLWQALVFKDRNYAEAAQFVFGVLICQKEYDLAFEFFKFLEDRNWTEYLKARLYLSIGDYTLASTAFRRPAFKLAMGMFHLEDNDTVAIISEDQKDMFSAGLPKYYQHVLGLFEKAKAYSFVAEFAKLALNSMNSKNEKELKTELLSRLFTASMQTLNFGEAYSALARFTDTRLQRNYLQTLVTTMIQNSEIPALLKFPFARLTNEVDAILSSLAHKALNVSSGPPYHQILYAFRISRNDFRGAAVILYDRLQRLKGSSSKVHDPADESMIQCYLMLINTLSSVTKEEAYILAEPRLDNTRPSGIGKAKKMLKRQIVTLEMLRKEYAVELDRVAALENGEFPFMDGGDEMDIL
ncbi:hypothetical protein GQ43DRAFT_397349 [Delitschia confertaspora ATCC 74209]|uniref:Uncharacterized protein n=1 Tax=Delitschia confertaspora ATCC 74209 TaxID=1513339 RepID=A0A9P4JIK0_9PLEO|nr:hypothetical protein GQ43DRAFT_397349 [Delitschia confertaspora ATCC 74209]